MSLIRDERTPSDSGLLTIETPLSTAARSTAETDCLVIFDWMYSKDGLGLNLSETMLYALAYRHSSGGRGIWICNARQLSTEFPMSEAVIRRHLKKLVDTGLLRKSRSKVTGAGGAKIDGPNAYQVELGPISSAFDCLSLAKKSRNLSYQQSADRNSLSDRPTGAGSYQQDAGRPGLSDRLSMMPISQNDQPVRAERPTGTACNNIKTDQRLVEEDKDEDECRSFLTKDICESFSSSALAERSAKDSADRDRCIHEMISSSSKRSLITGKYAIRTANAFDKAMERGFSAARILACWKLYLEDRWRADRPAKDRDRKFEKFPLNWLQEVSNLYRWDAELKRREASTLSKSHSGHHEGLIRLPDRNWAYRNSKGELVPLGITKDYSSEEALRVARLQEGKSR